MKTTLIIILVSCSALLSRAQQMNFSVGAEKSVKQPEYGAYLGYETKGKWGVGAFYQAGLETPSEGNSMGVKNPFYGMNLQVPLAKSAKMLFSINLRAGMVNEKFFVVVPGLETRLQPFKRFGAVFGMGLRHGYPSASVKVITQIF